MDILNRVKSLPPTPETVSELKRQSARLEQVSGTLRQRDRTLFGMVEKAVQIKDTLRAQIYANELARVRNVQKVISQSQLAIDCISIRLESFLDICQVVAELKPVTQEIKSVSKEVSQVMPQFTSDMQMLSQVANEVLQSSNLNFNQQSLEGIFAVKSQEGADILREVSSMVEQNLHSSFPEPPIAVAPSMTATTLETVACSSYGSRITIEDTPEKQASKQKVSIWSNISDDVLKQLDAIQEKNRAKLEESLT